MLPPPSFPVNLVILRFQESRGHLQGLLLSSPQDSVWDPLLLTAVSPSPLAVAGQNEQEGQEGPGCLCCESSAAPGLNSQTLPWPCSRAFRQKGQPKAGAPSDQPGCRPAGKAKAVCSQNVSQLSWDHGKRPSPSGQTWVSSRARGHENSLFSLSLHFFLIQNPTRQEMGLLPSPQMPSPVQVKRTEPGAGAEW